MPEDSLDPRFRARLRAELMARVREDTAVASPRRRRGVRWALLAGSVAAASACAFVLFGGVTPRKPAPVSTEAGAVTVHCVAGAVAAGADTAVETTVTDGEGFAARAIAGCAELWRSGELGVDTAFQSGGALTERRGLTESTDEPAAEGRQSADAVPPLRLCAVPDQGAVVVPWITCADYVAARAGAEPVRSEPARSEPDDRP